MLVKRIQEGYEFESPTTNGAFIVKLTLKDSGEETLETIPVGVPVSFSSLSLESGTIEKTIGTERWENFLKMKEQGISAMFVDPHAKGFIPHIW